MERATPELPETPVPRLRYTALRALACLGLCGAFLSGGSLLSVGLTTVLAIATLIAVWVAYELSIRDVSMEWTTAAVLAVLWSSGLGYGAWFYTRPPQPIGPLLPANDATPPTDCHETVSPNDLVMIAAENRVVGKGAGPFRMLAVDDCPVLTLRRKGRGLLIDATFYDWTDDIAFRVADNVFEPMMPLQLRQYRPDPHTLVILDRFDQEVLYLRFLNPHALRLRGRFLCAEQPQAIIRDHAVLMGGVRIGGVFLGQHRDPRRRCVTVRAGQPPGLVLGSG
jgi:hypothetical protein